MTRVAVTLLVVIHFVASVWHDGAHKDLGIGLPPIKDAFIYTVIVAAPLLAGVLVWTRHVRIGLWLFTIAMLGSFVFGVYHHYILVSPDNVMHLPKGPLDSHEHFIDSATAIAVLEAAAVAFGIACLLPAAPGDTPGVA